VKLAAKRAGGGAVSGRNLRRRPAHRDAELLRAGWQPVSQGGAGRPLLSPRCGTRRRRCPPLRWRTGCSCSLVRAVRGGGQATKFYAGDLVRVRVRWVEQERSWAGSSAAPGAWRRSTPRWRDGEAAALAAKEGKASATTPRRARRIGHADEDERAALGVRVLSPFNHTEMRDSKWCCSPTTAARRAHQQLRRPPTTLDVRDDARRGELMYEPEVWAARSGTFEVACRRVLDDEGRPMTQRLTIALACLGGVAFARVSGTRSQARRVGQDRAGVLNNKLYTSSRAARSTRRCRQRRGSSWASRVRNTLSWSHQRPLYTIETSGSLYKINPADGSWKQLARRRVVGHHRASVHEGACHRRARRHAYSPTVERSWKPVGTRSSPTRRADQLGGKINIERSAACTRWTPRTARGKRSARPTTGPAPSARHLNGKIYRRDRRRAVRHRAQHRPGSSSASRSSPNRFIWAREQALQRRAHRELYEINP